MPALGGRGEVGEGEADDGMRPFAQTSATRRRSGGCKPRIGEGGFSPLEKEPLGQRLLLGGIEAEGVDGVEHPRHEADAREGLVVKAGNEDGLVGEARGGREGKPKEIWACEDAVEARAGGVVHEGVGIDAVPQPGLLLGIGERLALADAHLK